MGQTAISALFVDTRTFVAWVLPSMPTLRHCPGQGTPNPGWLLEHSEISAFKRRPRLAIHLLFLNVQYVNRLEMGRVTWVQVTQLLNVR